MKFLMHILFLIMTSITWMSYLQAASKVDSADTSCAQTIPSQTASSQVSHPSDEPGLKFNNAANISNVASSLRVSHNPEERVERTQRERHPHSFRGTGKSCATLHSLRSALHQSTGGFVQRTTAPITSFVSSHTLYIYVLRHIIR